MKKILVIILFISSVYYSFSNFIDETRTEYSIGLNDKTGFFGLVNKSWIKEMVGGEKYITAGGLLFVGSMGYEENHCHLPIKYSRRRSTSSSGQPELI